MDETHALRAGLHQNYARNSSFLIVRADGSGLWIGDGRSEDVTAPQVAQVAWAWTPVRTDGDGSGGEPIDPELIKELAAQTS